MSTQKTAKTHYTKAANGITFAYRRLGLPTGLPLLLHMHFRGTMDLWDPLLDTLGASRPVIIFDQAGVGASTGQIPLTFQGWADDLVAFVKSLGLEKIDLLGFSMGGAAVQMVALTEPALVRKLVLAGTSASEPLREERGEGIVWPREVPPSGPITELAGAETRGENEEGVTRAFFFEDEVGREAARGYWGRVGERIAEDGMEVFVEREVAKRQLAAWAEWSRPNPRNSWERLSELKGKVLVLNGEDDVLIPTSRSWELMRRIGHANLVIYPHAGHGFIWQFAEAVARDVGAFLNGEEGGVGKARL